MKEVTIPRLEWREIDECRAGRLRIFERSVRMCMNSFVYDCLVHGEREIWGCITTFRIAGLMVTKDNNNQSAMEGPIPCMYVVVRLQSGDYELATVCDYITRPPLRLSANTLDRFPLVTWSWTVKII